MGACVVGVLSTLLAAAAPAVPLRVTVLLSEDAPSFQAAGTAFVEALGVETSRVLLVSQRLAAGAGSLDDADVVLALGTAAARRIASGPGPGVRVFAVVGDPVSAGLSQGESGSRGELGGVSALPPLIEQLELVRAAAPDARRLGVVVNGSRPSPLLDLLVGLGPRAGLTIVALRAQRPEDVGAVLRQERGSFDAILALPDPSVWNGAALKATVIFALSERRPLFGFSRAFTRAGALASLSAEDYPAMGEQAAKLAGGRLGGGPVRIEAAQSRSLSVNVVVAQRLGLTLTRGLVERAKDVYR